ncbi:Hsp20/alpha crystallin family protein [Gammaproteobacteria bacterium]|nr:Hsp20/alpha crystallin family protein [Gammaproteobacteria bacterium]
MNLEKLKPWNWFKHEESAASATRQLPLTRSDSGTAIDSILRLQQQVDRWFEEFSSSSGLPLLLPRRGGLGRAGVFPTGNYLPQIDVSGDDKRYEIKLDVPGMTESDLSVEIKDDVLVIRGEKQERSEEKDKHYYRVERSHGGFQRTLALPDDADADEMKARLDKGVLRLEIPRRDSVEQGVKRIEISS